KPGLQEPSAATHLGFLSGRCPLSTEVKCSADGNAYVIVYSITDRQSFQIALNLIKNIREREKETDRHIPIILVGNKSDLVRKRVVPKETARHTAFKYDCKFVETSAAINDKVDDLLAGILKQIRINDYNNERRKTITNTNEIRQKPSKNVFIKFLNVFRKKPRLPADVENLYTGLRRS
ncbi:unnamed protein product, partial [Didymodactylos carnosus]